MLDDTRSRRHWNLISAYWLAAGVLGLIWFIGFIDAFLLRDDGLLLEKVTFMVVWACHICDWLFSRSTHFDFAKSKRAPAWIWKVLMALSLALGLLGLMVDKTSPVSVGFVLYLCGLLIAARPQHGIKFPVIIGLSLLALAVPIRFLLFPIYDYLQVWATHAAAFGINLVYPGVEVVGFKIVTPPTYVNVTTACNGATVLVLTIATAIWTGLSDQRAIQVLARVLAAVGLCIGLNWVRIFAIGLMAHHASVEYTFGEFHDLAGHITFALCLLPFLWHSRLPDIWNIWLDWVIEFFKKLRNNKQAT